MTPQARQAIKAAVAKLRDLGEKGRGSGYFEGLGWAADCSLCRYVTQNQEPCPVFKACRLWGGGVKRSPCSDYTPPGFAFNFDRIVAFTVTENADPMSIRTFKRWCLSAAVDLEQRFLKGEK